MNEEEVQKWKEVLDKIINIKINNANYDVKLTDLSSEEKEVFLKELGVEKSEEYDKPWSSDSTKSNKAFTLSLKEDPD